MLFGACFFISLLLAFKVGTRQTYPFPAPKEASEEERRKAERMREGFNQLMSYDVTTATKGKKVVH